MTKTGDEQHQSINSTARHGIIKKAVRDITALEAKRKTIGEQIREIKQTVIKGDLNFKISDFNAALRLYGLEDEDRAEFLETLSITFRALGVGEQLDFLSDPKKTDADVRPAFLQGKDGEADAEPAVT